MTSIQKVILIDLDALDALMNQVMGPNAPSSAASIQFLTSHHSQLKLSPTDIQACISKLVMFLDEKVASDAVFSEVFRFLYSVNAYEIKGNAIAIERIIKKKMDSISIDVNCFYLV